MKNVSGKSYRESQITNISSITFFFENRVVYEIMWKIMYSWTGHRWQYGACAWYAG